MCSSDLSLRRIPDAHCERWPWTSATAPVLKMNEGRSARSQRTPQDVPGPEAGYFFFFAAFFFVAVFFFAAFFLAAM